MISRSVRTLLALVLLAGPSAAAVAGQAAPSGEAPAELRRTFQRLPDSARVRLFAPGVMVEDGVFLGLQRDSVLVSYADATFPVGLMEIEGLSVQGSRWLSTGVQAGAVALVAGAAAGFFLGYFHCGDYVQDCGGHARGVALRWSLVFGAAGGITGGVLGSRMHQWREVFP